jgi:uncharacterized membrane protein
VTLPRSDLDAGLDAGPGTSAEPPVRAPNALLWLYVLGGATGFLASFALTVEKIDKLADPSYVPSCDLNPVVSCGAVMDSTQGALFGFPNPLIGIAAFAVVITAGVVLLGGFRPPRWFWVGMQIGTTLGVAFVHWLIFQTLYEIHALCPWCMVVWTVTIPIFWYTTLHNLQRSRPRIAAGPAAALARFHSLGLVLWYLLIVVLILEDFWTFWIGML